MQCLDEEVFMIFELSLKNLIESLIMALHCYLIMPKDQLSICSKKIFGVEPESNPGSRKIEDDRV